MTKRQFMIICYLLWYTFAKVPVMTNFDDVFEEAERVADRYDN